MAKTDPLVYESNTDAAKPITLTIDGDQYDFTPHKIARTVLPMMESNNGDYRTEMARETWRWFFAGLPDDQAKRLRGKLDDEDDPLDYPLVSQIANDMIRRVSGRPTKRR